MVTTSHADTEEKIAPRDLPPAPKSTTQLGDAEDEDALKAMNCSTSNCGLSKVHVSKMV